MFASLSSLLKTVNYKSRRLIKSIYIPRYLCDPQLQRRVGRQLNKGEAIHDLRHFLMFANEGKIRKAQLEDQANQAAALTLVTNAIIVWNTRYIQAIIEQLREEGHQVKESDIAHVSPLRVDGRRLVGLSISTNMGSTSSMSRGNETESN